MTLWFVCPICLLVLFPSCHKTVTKQVVSSADGTSETKVQLAQPTGDVAEGIGAIAALEKPTTLDDQFSYTYGYLLFMTFKNQFTNLNGSYFARGVADAVRTDPFFSQEEMTAIFKQVQEKMLAQANEEQKQLADKNLKASNAFLATNKTAEGVYTMDNGVQYQIISPGDGSKPLIKDYDTVTLNYSVALVDGTLVESTWRRGHTETFVVSSIPQATVRQGLELMRPGSHYKMWIPPEMAYGDKGLGVIGPNQLLVVETEIVAVTTQANQ